MNLLSLALIFSAYASAGTPPDCIAHPNPQPFPFPASVFLVPENTPALRKGAECVSPQSFGSSSLRAFSEAMANQMFASRGLGIAAPQVGISQRIFVARTNPHNLFDRAFEVFINPRVIRVSGNSRGGSEGCLSLPGKKSYLSRWMSVRIEYFTIDGTRKVADLNGLSAILMQHETDHLNGTLISDHGIGQLRF